MRYLFILLALLVFTANCKKREVTEDASLYGNWSDDLVKYTFNSDMTFGKKTLVPDPFDTLQIDSSWGDFEVYNNEVLVFTFSGYQLKTGLVIDSTYLGPTWSYTIDGNTLRYQSSTNLGSLLKLP